MEHNLTTAEAMIKVAEIQAQTTSDTIGVILVVIFVSIAFLSIA